jgi:hypothetical protein
MLKISIIPQCIITFMLPTISVSLINLQYVNANSSNS